MILPSTSNSLNAHDMLQMDREIFISTLQKITTENAEWNKILLEESARYNAALLDAKQAHSRRSHVNFESGDTVMYNNRKYIISSVRHGTNPNIPTTAVLQNPDNPDESERRVKFAHLRPAVEPAAIPNHPLAQPIPEEGSFIFYGTTPDIHAGLVHKPSSEGSYVLFHQLS